MSANKSKVMRMEAAKDAMCYQEPAILLFD